MADNYYCLLTDAGAALEAAAHAAGKPVIIKSVVVGDGGGEAVTPDSSATQLINQVYENAPDYLEQDAEDPKIFWVNMTIPTSVGGFWVREVGVYAEPLEEGGDPVLLVYGSHAAYYKSTITANQTLSHVLKLPIIMSSEAQLTINVSETGYASAEEMQTIAGILSEMRSTQKEASVELEAAVSAGESVALPSGLTFAPGYCALQVAWQGLKLVPGRDFTEGEDGASFVPNFPMLKGDVLDFVVLGHSTGSVVVGTDSADEIAQLKSDISTKIGTSTNFATSFNSSAGLAGESED